MFDKVVYWALHYFDIAFQTANTYTGMKKIWRAKNDSAWNVCQ